MNSERSRGRGNSKKRWLDAIKSGMRITGVSVDDMIHHVSGGLGHGQPTPNGWNRGEDEKEEEEIGQYPNGIEESFTNKCHRLCGYLFF